MEKSEEVIPVLPTHVGATFDITLISQMGSTGYGWYLADLPEGLVLVGIKTDHVVPPPAIGSIRHIFTFTSAKVGKFELEFQLLRIWIPMEPAKKVTYHVVVSEDAPTYANRLGSEKFIPHASHLAHQGPLPPYGFPAEEWKDKIIPLYGFPIDYNTVSVIEDADRCILMYGVPYGVAKNKEDCTLKYGFPVGVKEELDSIVVKYGSPNKVVENKDNCVILYGTPGGIASKAEDCVLKYGFPVKE